MDSENLKRLKADIDQKIIDAINTSNVGKVFQEYDFIADKHIQVEYTLDLTKIQLGDAVEGPQAREFLQAIPEQEIMLVTKSFCIPCPNGNPQGCNC